MGTSACTCLMFWLSTNPRTISARSARGREKETADWDAQSASERRHGTLMVAETRSNYICMELQVLRGAL